jgi:hypothetical protein
MIRAAFRSLLGVVRAARRARSLTRKSVTSQLFECAALRRGTGRLRLSEYYAYRLFDDDDLTLADKRCFIGQRRKALINFRLNDPSRLAISNDKLTLYAVCRGLGIPIPKIYAIFDPHGRVFGDVSVFRTPASLEAFLRDGMRYPFFSKPSRDAYGRFGAAVARFDRETDELVLLNGARQRLPEYVKQLKMPADLGHVFQELLRPNPVLATSCGGTVSTVRMAVLKTAAGHRLLNAVWKIPVAGTWNDNFKHGKSGNMLGLVDPETGRVSRVIGGTGFDQRLVQRHPDTGEPLAGCQLPDWRVAKELALTAAGTIPGCRIQHWDIALCENGPLALEMNFDGDLDLYQHASHRGVYGATLKDAVAGAPKITRWDSRP